MGSGILDFILYVPTAIGQFVEEHPDECKLAAFVILGLTALVAALCVLCALVPAVLAFVGSLGQTILTILGRTVNVAVKAITLPVQWVLEGAYIVTGMVSPQYYAVG